MKQPLTTDEFLAFVCQCGLLTTPALDDFQERHFGGQPPTGSADEVARLLLQEKLLTPFQSKQLLSGRFRGFFVADKYKILEFLGQGGMGRVVLCEHLLLQRLVALKLMNLSLESIPGAVDRFLREARVAGALDHPNIARVFDVDRSDRGPYIVLEYVDGANLHQIIAQHGAFSVERTAQYIRQAALGLEHAHQAGLVHRDIKPGNLMLDRSGVVKLLDLGLARFFDSTKSDHLTQQHVPKSILGTADFIAPEQALDSTKSDIRADIYSLGFSMYFLLSARQPLGDGTIVQKLLWHQIRDPDPVQSLRPDVPDDLAAVLAKMVKKNPAERFQTPAEVAEALAPWATEKLPPPPAHEMPKVTPTSFRLGLCPPPSRLAPKASASTNSSLAAESPTANGRPGGAGKSAGQRVAVGANSQAAPGRSAAAFPRGAAVKNRTPTPVPAPSAIVPLADDLLDLASPAFSQPLSTLQSTAFAPPAAPLNQWQMILIASLIGVIVVLMGGGLIAWLASGNSPQTAQVQGNPANVAPANSLPEASANKPEVKTPPAPEKPAPAPPAPAAPAPSTGIVLRGGGSTFVKPIMEHWAKLYEKKVGVKIEYTGVGSSKGVEGVTSKFLDFGCTDAFLSEKQLAEAPGAMIHVPLVMGAVAPTFNVRDAAGKQVSLRFTGPLLANIFLGNIKKWNDPAIAVNNPGLTLPDQTITVVYRKEGSGTTSIWTDYLSKASADWKSQIGAGTKVNWPVGTAAEKNDGVADMVSRTSGAIGYVELSFALANSLPVGAVKNKAGEFVTPSIDGITAAAAASLENIPGDMRFSLTDAPGQSSYPIVGVCWAVVFIDQPVGKGAELVKFLRWATTEGQQYAGDLKYGRLPPELASRISSSLGKVQVGK